MTHAIETRTALLQAGPYLGLVPYTADDRAFFFGRQRDTDLIVANLVAYRLTLLYGPSGVGKSSVLAAGVVPALQRRTNRTSDGSAAPLVVTVNTWREDPRTRIDDAIDDAAQQAGHSLTVRPDNEWPLAKRLEHWSDQLGTRFYFVFDQFEEYFLYHQRRDDDFAGELANAVTSPSTRSHFLLALREDAWAKLDRFEGLIPNLFDNYYRLEHLRGDDAREAICGPIEEFNRRVSDDERVTIEPNLVSIVLEQVRAGRVLVGAPGEGRPQEDREHEGIETAHLQLVMQRLWDAERKAGSHELRSQTLADLGGAAAIVREHVESCLTDLTPADRALAARIFRELVTPSGAKVVHSLDDLAAYAGVPTDALIPTLEQLQRARILRAVDSTEERPDVPRYEIFHDALAGAILEWRQREDRAQREAETQAELAAANAKARVERQRRRLLTVISVVLFAALAYAIVTTRQNDDLRREKASLATRQESEGLAAQAGAELSGNPQLALEHSLRAVELTPTTTAVAAVRLAMAKPYVTKVFAPPVAGVDFGLKSVDESPDGSLVAGGGLSGVARIWDTKSNNRYSMRGFKDWVTSVHVSATTPARVLATSRDGTARIYDDHGHRLGPVLHHNAAVTNGAFSPDGSRIVTMSDDFVARIWSMGTGGGAASQPVGTPIGAPLSQGSELSGAVWSPDSSKLATWSNDGGTIHLWSADGASLATLPAPGVQSVAFSADGTTVAFAGLDGTTQLWHFGDRKLTKIASGNVAVRTVAFDPRRGSRLVTTDGAGVVRLIEIGAAGITTQQIQTGRAVDEVAFGPEPFLVTSASGNVAIWDTSRGVAVETLDLRSVVSRFRLHEDGTYTFLQSDARGKVRLWQGRTAAVVGSLGQIVESAAITPDRQHWVALSKSGAGWAIEVRPYPKLSAGHLMTLPAPASGEANSWAWATDAHGRLVATASIHVGRAAAARLDVWDTATGAIRSELQSHFPNGDIVALTMSGDGNWVAVSGWDNASKRAYVEVFSSDGKSESRRVSTREFRLLDVSPDGRTLAVGDTDGSTAIWSLPNMRDIGTLSSARGRSHSPVDAVAFSDDGRRIATGHDDGRVVIWDAATREVLGRLDIGSRRATFVEFSPDGTFVTVDSPNAPAEVFSVATGLEVFVDPVAELENQSSDFEASGSDLVTSDGSYVLRSHCEACVPTSVTLQNAKHRLALVPPDERFDRTPSG
ncbi:MAG: WD40 repeat domain-containing protein [Acidimicrobiia bacterium]